DLLRRSSQRHNPSWLSLAPVPKDLLMSTVGKVQSDGGPCRKTNSAHRKAGSPLRMTGCQQKPYHSRVRATSACACDPVHRLEEKTWERGRLARAPLDGRATCAPKRSGSTYAHSDQDAPAPIPPGVLRSASDGLVGHVGAAWLRLGLFLGGRNGF